MLVKWQPFNTAIERDWFFDDMVPTRNRMFHPSVDIEETEKSYLIKAELPGLNKDDFKVTVENNILTLEGEKKSENREEREGYYHSERRYGFFKRSFRLTDSVDSNKVNADYTNGILTINVPKAKKTLSKQIDVKVS